MADVKLRNGLLDFARRYVFKLWPWYLLGSFFLVTTNLITLAIPRLASEVVDALGGGEIEAFASIPLAILGLGLLLIVVRVSSRIFFFWPGRSLEARVRQDVFEKILVLPLKILRKFGQGDLVSRISNDTGYLRVLFAFGFLSVVNVIVLLVMTIGSMLELNPELTLLALSPFFPLLFLVRKLLPKMHAASRSYQESIGDLTSVMTESFRGLVSVRLHSAQEAFLARVDSSNERVFQASRRLALLETVVFPVASLVVYFSQAVILGYGGYQVIEGSLTAGEIMVFSLYMSGLAFPLAFLGGILALIERARSAERRVNEILCLKTENEALGDRDQVKKGALLLEVKNLGFRHGSGFSLEAVEFQLQAGRRLGLCGAIGAGKSLLFDLLTRFENPSPGTVFYRGIDVLELPVEELRKKIGYALQTARLLSGTIRQNLVFGLERDSSDDELYSILEMAAIADEIRAFPEGLDTLTGEKGVRLSGGQRQRLALARLFLRSPEIYLLDDVLSAVDQKTELDLVRVLFDSQAAFIIASHRPGVLEFCDEVLFLKDGRVEDRGLFKDLAQRHPSLLARVDRRPD